MTLLRTTRCGVLVFMLAAVAGAQPAGKPLSLLDVPFIAQTEALCGGAAAAMVLRYWGERGLTAESFAHLVDRSAAGIRTTALVGELSMRGWSANAVDGTDALLTQELARGRPVLALIEDRPGTFHYVVLVGSTERTVVFHDPARAPFRVMSREEFDRRWRASRHWMAIVVPGVKAESPVPEAASSTVDVGDRCARLVAEGVREAQAGNLDAAVRTFAAALSCPGSAPLRELAGVRLLQRRWTEASDLAEAAVSEDPRDEHAWRLLATSRFVQDDRVGALAAWNAVGEPRLDLFVSSGLSRTDDARVQEVVGLQAGATLTPERFSRAERRLADLPAAAATRLEYVPIASGIAEVRAFISELPLLPTDRWSYAAVGLRAAGRREVQVSVGSLTGGGERYTGTWRFWPSRPLVSGSVDAPAPWGGNWSVAAFTERQPFDRAGIPEMTRAGARLELSNWLTSRVKATGRASIEGRGASRDLLGAGGAFLFSRRDNRLDAGADVGAWLGRDPFSRVEAVANVRSTARHVGRVYLLRAGVASATADTPPDMWFAGDTGHARSVLLRAHPLVRGNGEFRADRLGRVISHASGEVRQWWSASPLVRVAAAAFVDSARVGRRLALPRARGDVDAGAGVRIAVTGTRGIFRVDVAKGLRDGATAVSFVYEP